ncbi:MAG: Hsp33 family molecular chaperone HslO [Neisseriaceae bacterium]|nr:Hsp33 family molecular chaperone HslO [Neisseriaceae bacterium]
MENLNQKQRFLFDHAPVRGIHVQLNNVWQDILQQKAYPKAIEKALGELLAAGVLLASNLKFDGQLILQVQGQGVLKMLVVEATSDHTCRATARWDDSQTPADDADLKSLLGEGGVFVMTLQPKGGEQWQGIVALSGDSIAQMLMDYMKQSEQLATHISLAHSDQAVAGLLLQKLPQEAFEDPNEWQNLEALTQTVKAEELLTLPAETVLYRLYHESPPRLFEAEDVAFACTCSQQKVSDMLLLIGGEEVGSVLNEQGSIQINCDFCHKAYVFDEADVTELFGMDVGAAVAAEQQRNQ